MTGRVRRPTSPPASGPTAWGVVVPVKLLSLAKTRLAAYGADGRAELALAFADDVVTAALACPAVVRVVVVTDDVRAAETLRRPGTCVVADLPGAGLNPALVHGAELLRRSEPEVGVAALTSDVPALRPSDLDDVLAAVTGRAFVPDTEDVGTTLLAAAPGSALQPAFGEGSGRRHLRDGAVRLEAPASLRRDVDTPADLQEALALGVGPRTSAVAAALHAAARR